MVNLMSKNEVIVFIDGLEKYGYVPVDSKFYAKYVREYLGIVIDQVDANMYKIFTVVA